VVDKQSPLMKVGAYTYGTENVAVLAWGEGAKLEIGKFCAIGTGVSIFLGGNHRVDWATTYPFGHIHTDVFGGSEIKGHPATKGDVIIGNDVWIGTGVSIMSGVTIGNGAVICARSHVVKDVGDYEVVGGNPAKHIKFRFDKETIDNLLELKWWDMTVEEIREMVPLLCSKPKTDRGKT